VIQLQNISLSYGSQKVFDHINLTVASTDRIGLVGRNGAGKSTMLKAIGGAIELDSGSISIGGKYRVAYLPQEVVLNSDRSILEETVSAYKIVGPLRQKAQKLEPLVAAGDADAVHEYAEVSERLAQLNVEKALVETKKVLIGLGFKQGQLDDSVTTLSVGWQMRVVLAKILLQDADFYLFDEPTNHLDIVAKDWFLQFLKEAKFGFMLVSHDRYFLDRLCTTIFELDRGQGKLYYGNYIDYEEQKEHDLEALHAAAHLQQKEIAQKKRTIERFRAKSSKAKMAKSMEKSLQKVELIELPQQAKSVHFNFAEPVRAGKTVLEVNNLSYAFDAKQIFKDVTFSVERGQKVALVAPNGGGKTTLFNVLAGKYKSPTGSIHLGHNVTMTIFEQEQHKVLDPKKTVLQEVMDNTYNKSEQQIRTFLGSFLFSKNEVVKKTKVLSGGERNRVSMVKVLLQDANFLLLDEPTNHLDIQSKEILFQALSQFKGTVLFVSHDHDFVNKLANRVLELTSNGVNSYFGNYEEFLAQKGEADNLDSTGNKESSPRNSSHKDGAQLTALPRQQKKQVHDLEKAIEKLEKAIERINSSFADLEYGTSEFDAAQKKLQQKEQELIAVTHEWEQLL
jgi:ATP-binding cassette subfamily F protein 3